jgi:hypothetical protein
MKDVEKLASWRLEHGFSTGHGETIDELLGELSLDIAEMRQTIKGLRARAIAVKERPPKAGGGCDSLF